MRLSQVHKALNIKEREDLVRRKNRARRISQAGGTLGLAALASRVPQGAKAVAGRSVQAGRLRPMAQLVAIEPRATSASNTLGVLSIGAGSAGSFNYAGLQRMEAKDQVRAKKSMDGDDVAKFTDAGTQRQGVAKFNPLSAGKVVDALEGGGLSTPLVMVGSDRKEKRKERKRKQGQLVPVTKAALKPLTSPGAVHAYAQSLTKKKPRLNPMGRYVRTSRGTPMDSRFWDWENSKIGKRDDRFLRTHRDRISTDAERGYLYLKEGRNKNRRHGAAYTALAAADAGALAHYGRRPITGSKTVMRGVKDAAGKVNVVENKVLVRGARRSPAMAGAAGVAMLGTGALALDHGRTAHRWNAKMGKIEARAKQRARDGQWGRDRRGDVAKAVVGDVSKIRIRTGIRRGYGARVGGLVRRGNRTWTRRGSIQGSGRLFR